MLFHEKRNANIWISYCHHYLYVNIKLPCYNICRKYIFCENIFSDDLKKYYLHSPESLVAYKCLWRNFCDVILLQASKKKKKINIIWKNSIQSSNIQFLIFMKMRKQNPFFIISWFIFTKAFHCRPWCFKGNGW